MGWVPRGGMIDVSERLPRGPDGTTVDFMVPVSPSQFKKH